jgi:hypothetical protein
LRTEVGLQVVLAASAYAELSDVCDGVLLPSGDFHLTKIRVTMQVPRC